MDRAQQKKLELLCPSVQWRANMAAYSSLRAGGAVEAMVEVTDCAILPQLLHWLEQEKLCWQILGGGSNILFTSGLHRGVFIRLKGGLKDITHRQSPERPDEHLVEVGAGVSVALLLAWCLRRRLGGLEFMAGIPGTVGGAVAMNAGAFGGTVSDRLVMVHCLNAAGRFVTVPATDIVFQYRTAIFPPQCTAAFIITRTVFAMWPTSAESIGQRMREIIAQRKAKQPGGVASAGSFFKNPPGDYAGRLIEQAGLKGYTLGQAMVSAKHGNFIVNKGRASPEEILALKRYIQERVHACSGIMLEPEVRIY
ncbi:MAG: UDP-N-acetylmuramate dehydrogenase [Desulfobulbaceae bacterium]|nr:UDP-N-acetylmuramate dehydrogenase [Desulfobulbaceae bacterium]